MERNELPVLRIELSNGSIGFAQMNDIELAQYKKSAREYGLTVVSVTESELSAIFD